MARNQYNESRTLQDDVEDFIEDFLSMGYSKNEIIEEIAATFEGFDIGLASDAYEDWERDNDPSNEEATIGDIERYVDELLTEGFPEDEALEKASKRYSLSTQEIRSMLENKITTQALSYLNRIEEAVDRLTEGDFGPEFMDNADPIPPDDLDDDESLYDVDTAMEILDSLRAEGWDEVEAATYIIEADMGIDSESPEGQEVMEYLLGRY